MAAQDNFHVCLGKLDWLYSFHVSLSMYVCACVCKIYYSNYIIRSSVFSDVNFLTSTAPPAAAEWQSLLRPLRGREPEGMWNLLSIAREMFRRSDNNAIPLMEIITDEVLQCEQVSSSVCLSGILIYANAR